MKIGMSLTTSYSSSRDSRELMENLIEQVKLMADLSFDSLSLGDHHVTSDHYFQVLPTMSHVAAYAGDMQLLPLFLLPFYNPILLAEQLATLDVITGGRVTMISGLGHQPEAHDAFQTPQRVRVSRFVETFEIMRLLWERNDASHHGKHYSFDGVSISPKPLKPLQMWIGAMADPAIRRTAQIADAWVIGPGWPPDLIEEKLGVYRRALDELDREEHIKDFVLRRDVHLSESAETAREEMREVFERGYRGFGPKEMQESLIVGGAQECIGYLEKMQRLGVNHVLFRCALDEPARASQTIRVLGTEVIPHFRRTSPTRPS
ncbi:MAG: LLM class flavin-dependent oxidoreductase [Chloroflexi bacterium]|nr:LLM class flavin-dependent oxidoreductase [Chloroflexota bacterium]